MSASIGDNSERILSTTRTCISGLNLLYLPKPTIIIMSEHDQPSQERVMPSKNPHPAGAPLQPMEDRPSRPMDNLLNKYNAHNMNHSELNYRLKEVISKMRDIPERGEDPNKMMEPVNFMDQFEAHNISHDMRNDEMGFLISLLEELI
jgi:hypothetical protein